MATERHNYSARGRTDLTLSEVGRYANASCVACGAPFEARRSTARYCSDACRQVAFRRRGAEARRAVYGSATDPNRLPEPLEAHHPRSDPKRAKHARRVETSDLSPIPMHAHDGRLCVPCITARHEQLKPAPRARVSAAAVAARIRADHGDVFGAVSAFGISYEHALRIRRGWRGAGRSAEPIPFRSRGWVGDGSGHRVGWHSRAGAQSLAQLYGVTVIRGGLELRRKVGAAG